MAFYRHRLGILAAAWVVGLSAGSARAEDAPAAGATPDKAAAAASLASEQRQIAERFDKLKEKLLRMAELTAGTDPRRASLLRKAVAQANDQYVTSLYRHNVAKLSLARALGAGQSYKNYLGGK